MPTLVARTVTGTCKDAGGNPYPGKAIYFHPTQVFGADGVIIGEQSLTAVTNDDGLFSIDLYTLDTVDAFVRYACILPSGDTVDVDLEYGDGSSIGLDALIDLGSLGNADLTAALAAMQDIVDDALETIDGGLIP
jgi:hypothetical protein